MDMELLQQKTELPIIGLSGEKYYLDGRLGELRRVGNPKERVEIEEFLREPNKFLDMEEDWARAKYWFIKDIGKIEKGEI